MSSDAPPSFPMPSTVYGPVRSWRVGNSLGIDLIVERSTCSFNCVYCQLGNIMVVTMEQRVYVPSERVFEDLRGVDWSSVDIVTFSGSGEPTLALNIGEVIAHIADTYRKPTMVLTNATWLHDAATRGRLSRASVVSCKLDAADDEMLRKFNRVEPSVSHAKIVEGIKALRAEFPGKLAIQTMLMPLNVGQAERIAELVAEIGPDEWQLNTPLRPYPKKWYLGSRGNHVGDAPVDTVSLKTISQEQASAVEAALRRRAPGIPIVSVYRTAPKV